MKNQFLIVLFGLLSVTLLAQGQSGNSLFRKFSHIKKQPLGTKPSRIVNSYMEKTKDGMKLGATAGFKNVYGIEWGCFYQRDVKIQNETKSTQVRRMEDKIIGFYFAGSIFDSRYFNSKIHARVGIVDGEGLAIIPTMFSYFKAGDRLRIGGGVGLRAYAPTYLTSLSIIF
ncbi:MAG: hypothetical protein AAGC64_10985 [Bacteroidota bacterium]